MFQESERKVKGKDKKNNKKEEGEVQGGEDKVNSVFIAEELIKGKQQMYGKRLLDFKTIKNPNYEKFSERIYQNLRNNEISFNKSTDILFGICNAANEENTTNHQVNCIIHGFSQFWKQTDIDQEDFQSLFNFIDKISILGTKKYINTLGQLAIQHKISTNFLKHISTPLINDYLTGNQLQQLKIFPLIHAFNDINTFPLDKIIFKMYRNQNINDILYIFKDKDQKINEKLVLQLIKKCSNNDNKQDLKKCQILIKHLKLDPYQFPLMIQKMIQKFLNYQMRTHKLYFIELVINYDVNIIKCLIRLLVRSKRMKDAIYFMVNYKCSEDYDLDDHQIKGIQNTKNILMYNDHFGPTQSHVLAECQEGHYLHLEQLGLTFDKIGFIDSTSIQAIDIQQIFKNKTIGIDTQSTGGIHVFDQPRTTLLQVFTGEYILIFDYFNLQDNQTFKRIMEYVFTNCKIYGQDHQKQITSIQRQLELKVSEPIMQELQRQRTIDTSKYFKKVFPKESRCNLVYICQFLMKKRISKFQQCSGWRNRPLRLSQIHYASIDCILPLRLGQMLQEIQKNNKKHGQKPVKKVNNELIVID